MANSRKKSRHYVRRGVLPSGWEHMTFGGLFRETLKRNGLTCYGLKLKLYEKTGCEVDVVHLYRMANDESHPSGGMLADITSVLEMSEEQEMALVLLAYGYTPKRVETRSRYLSRRQ